MEGEITLSNKILAVVNGREITEAMFNNFKETLNPQVMQQFAGEEGEKRLLDEVINQELFYAEAVEEKIDETDEFKVHLDEVKINLMKQFKMKNLLADIQVDVEDAHKFYEENKERFMQPELAKAKHILVETEEQAKEVKAKLDGGLAFADAAAEFSSCPSKDNGGDLGEFGKGQMVPEFEEATWAATVGVVTEPVKTQFGYHLILVDEIIEPVVSSFDDVAQQIFQHLQVTKQNQIYAEKVEDLKSRYEVKINE